MTERLNVPEAELAEALVLAARVIVEQKDRADAAEALLAELQALAEDFRVKELAAQHRWVQAEVRLAEAQAEIDDALQYIHLAWGGHTDPLTLQKMVEAVCEERTLLEAKLEELKAGCVCQECGETYREDVRLSDDLWNRIRPSGKLEGAGLLCGGCIGRRLTGMVEELTRERDKLEAGCTTECHHQFERAEAAQAENVRLLFEAEKQADWNGPALRNAEAKLARVVWILENEQYDRRASVALAAARDQPTQDKLPLGHAFEPCGQTGPGEECRLFVDEDACHYRLRRDDPERKFGPCGQPESAHQPTQDKGGECRCGA
jgi:hypothetical protein